MHRTESILMICAAFSCLTACENNKPNSGALSENDVSMSNNFGTDEQVTADEPTASSNVSAVDPIAAGDRKVEALKLINDAGHSCDAVVTATALADSTMAVCSDGEKYRISRVTMNGKTATLAMKCSAAEAVGVSCE